MFELDTIVDFNNLLNDDYIFFAHNRELNEEKETLQEHINRCIQHFMSIVKAKKMEDIFRNFVEQWFPDNEQYSKFFEMIIINTIVFHDLGKINPLFQKEKMKNSLFLKEKGNLIFGSDHSIISSILYLEYFLSKCIIFPKEIKKKFRLLIYINAYVISKHHGNLGDFDDFLDSFYTVGGKNRICVSVIRKEYKKYFVDTLFLEKKNYELSIKSVKNFVLPEIEDRLYFYAYEKLIYSMLVVSDYYATTEFSSKFIIDSHGTIEDIDDIIKVYNNTEVNKNIEYYRLDKYFDNDKQLEDVKDINILRNELYLDAESELLKNLNHNLFYLEAPTGSGKSNVAFNLSFQLIKHCKSIGKIMYIYPFNTLVEQNLSNIEKFFSNNKEILSNISVINSITPILKEGDSNYSFSDYEKALLDRQFFNYPITLSTHVTLFDLMFGKNKESGFAFYQLTNSVIVLDEIQSYKNTIWTEIISFLKAFAKILNIKIIIMSATLPDLDLLSYRQNKAVKLIRNRNKYFQHPLFKDRVALNYDLLDASNPIEELTKKINYYLLLGKKILVEFNKKKSAIEFYNNFIKRNKDNSKIELITGDDSSLERKRILTLLENTEEGIPFLLVSTQVIEAGVDLNNIDVGFKDISKLDSEEQFLGRINRSSKNKGIVYFFDYDNVKELYKEDVRINDELTLKSKKMRDILKEKRFDLYYKEVLKMVYTQNNSYALDKNINEFFIQVGKLNNPAISEKMKLINDDEWSCTVFLNRRIKLTNGENLDGEMVWNEYKHLLKNKNDYNYAEWRIKLSIVKSKLTYFTYQINSRSLFPYTEQIGEIFYIDDSEQYFEEGKFIRDKLENQIGTFI